MSKTGLEVFDTTLHETNHWLKLMMEELETDNRRHAFTVLRATLHALRDRIGPANAVHLGAQLPMLLRGAYYEGWRLADTPTHEHHMEGFLVHVDSELTASLPFDAADAVRATFNVLSKCLDGGTFEKLNRLLPVELRAPAAILS
jgi:uncharacterized protein (DUF2267 family)